MIGGLVESIAGGAIRWLAHRRLAKTAGKMIAENTEAEITLSREHAEALRIKAASSLSGTFIIVWYLALATYAAFGAPWGTDVDKIHALLRDPGVLLMLTGVFGIGHVAKVFQ